MNATREPANTSRFRAALVGALAGIVAVGLVTSPLASAARLDVDGGVLQAFAFDSDEVGGLEVAVVAIADLNLLGASLDEAERRLNEAGLEPVFLDGEDAGDESAHQTTAEHADYEVVGTEPGPDAEVEKGSEVVLIVEPTATHEDEDDGTEESELIAVPDVLDAERSDAQKTLEEAGLEASLEGDGDTVTATDPEAGEKVEKGTAVEVVLKESEAEETEKVEVPDVIGKDDADAEERLDEAGLGASLEGEGTVEATDPKVGDEVATGTTVALELEAEEAGESEGDDPSDEQDEEDQADDEDDEDEEGEA